MQHGEQLPAVRSSAPQIDPLVGQWRSLSRAATIVAVLTSPAVFIYLHSSQGMSTLDSLVFTVIGVLCFRGFVDVVTHRLIPWPSLFGTEATELREEDVVNRRRAWFWRFWVRLAVFVLVAVGINMLLEAVFGIDVLGSLVSAAASAGPLLLLLPLYMVFNFAILFGPLMLMGITQIKAYEPGDADWGVRLEDVRGQAEAKEEVRRVVTLWQSGEAFEQAGGKRERGLLLLGAPGTGKTMLSKAIATSFNCPFVSIPGSGFAQTFIGMDAVIVRWLSWRAKRLARKWGGQCIIFIDEIDAVGMRRASLGQGQATVEGPPRTIHDVAFHGPNGALNPSGDLILESRAWIERLFAERDTSRPGSPYPAFVRKLGSTANAIIPGMFGGGGGGQLALNQLLIVMDGIGDPPLLRRVAANRVNTLLDAMYVVPQRIAGIRLRLKKPRPRREQIYFIGACNVPIEALDPALTRPGRMGRHVWFRTPIADDRKDIFDLYLAKVSHDQELDEERRRSELARMTLGYSPAMIEQVCSMALTRAHYDGRERFSRDDIIEAMTTVESGTAINVEYAPGETRHIAIHEAGHAAAAHLYLEGRESVRLSVRMRGGSLGHHSARELEERFVHWRHEQFGDLVWGLGAMAAEHVFYGENSTGVGGDLAGVTAMAATMVGSWGMAPELIDLGHTEAEEQRSEELMKRFEAIGGQLIRRSGAGPFDGDPVSGVLGDGDKRRLVAQLIGQAYVAAYHVALHNRDKLDQVADVLVEKRELYGDDVVALLDRVELERPTVDLTEDAEWPKL